MQTTTTAEVGQLAPDFSLKGPAGQPVTLSEYRDKKNVVLVFFPLAFSPVCSQQLPAVEQHQPHILNADAVVLGISVDSHHANAAFAKSLGLSFPLLSDFHREVSAAYGVLDVARGTSRRAVFAIDKAGRIVHKDVSTNTGDVAQVPSHERALAVLSASA